MRKILAMAIAMAVVFSASAWAGQQTAKQSDPQQSQASKSVRGTLTQLDNNQKMFVVKDDSGKEVTIYWNDSTRISGGDLKEGATVSLQTMDQGGRTVATSIQVSAKKSY